MPALTFEMPLCHSDLGKTMVFSDIEEHVKPPSPTVQYMVSKWTVSRGGDWLHGVAGFAVQKVKVCYLFTL